MKKIYGNKIRNLEKTGIFFGNFLPKLKQEYIFKKALTRLTSSIGTEILIKFPNKESPKPNNLVVEF